MSKLLSAKEKANELGISLSGLRKTRHLYKHIRKGPKKVLYFAEDEREAIRPNKENVPPGSPKLPRHRRRDVPFGETKYSNVKGRGGHHQVAHKSRFGQVGQGALVFSPRQCGDTNVRL